MTTTFPANTTQTIDGMQFFIEDNGSDYAIQLIDPVTLRFQVNAGDQWSDDPVTKNRAEIASTQMIADGTPINVSYSMQIEPGSVNSADWMVLGQFHQDDYPGAPLLSPPFSINMNGQNMAVNIGYTGLNGQPVYLTVFQDSSPLVQGHNYAISISVTFDPNGNGRLVVTRDGATIVNYTGPLGYSTQSSVYWKEGIYEAASTTTMAVDYSNLQLSTGTPAASQPYNGVQTYQQLDGSGNVLSTTTNQYDPSGSLLVSTVVVASGASTVWTYQIQGQAYTSSYKTYNAQGVLTGETDYHADGTLAYQMQLTTAGVTTQSTFDASGKLISVTQIQADGSSTFCAYVAGTSVLTQYETFNTAGQLTLNEIFNADGSKSIQRFQIASQPYTSLSETINAAGAVVSLTQYYANGNPYYQQFIDAAGATEYKNYDSTGVLTRWQVINADGSSNISKYVNNALQTYEGYNASGVLILYETFSSTSTTTNQYDASGNLLVSTVVLASGASTVSTYQIQGQAYTSSVKTYNAQGVLTGETDYHADHTMAYQMQLSTAGVTTQSTFDATGKLISVTQIQADGSSTFCAYVAGASALTQYETFNTAGQLTFNEIFNADGSKSIQRYLIAGQPYTSLSETINPAGAMVSLTEYASTGKLYYQQYIDSAGATEYKNFDANGVLVRCNVVNTDGSSNTCQYGGANYALLSYQMTNTSGQLTLYEAFNSDGSQSINRYLITGQPYTSTIERRNAAGVTTSLNEYASTGLLYYQQFIDSNGATEYKKYNSAGILTNWLIQNVDSSKNLHVYSATGQLTNWQLYNTSGTLTYNQVYNTDGSYLITQYLITGKPYTTQTINYSNTNAVTQLRDYNANGTLYFSYAYDAAGNKTSNYYDGNGVLQQTAVNMTDGSMSMQLFSANLLANAIAGPETFTSYQADTFSFPSVISADVINGFNAGDGANHDVIQLSKALAYDYQHLNMAQVGSDTVIQFAGSESITLKGVAVAALTTSNFAFY